MPKIQRRMRWSEERPAEEGARKRNKRRNKRTSIEAAGFVACQVRTREPGQRR